MPRTSKRLKLSEGIWRDDYGISGVVKVGRTQTELRFPLGTDLKTIKAAREAEKVRLRAKHPTLARTAFARAARRYLAIVKGSLDKASFKSRRSEIRAWIRALGSADVRAIDAAALRIVISDWREAGRSPKTILNRVRTIGHMWRALFEVALPKVDLPAIPKRRPRFVTADIITGVEARLRAHEAAGQLPDSKTRARFMVMAATGMRPAQLKRMTASDLDLERRVVLIPAAKGGEPVGLWLNDDMLTAWRVFAAVKAWGHFDTRSFGRRIRTAGWPAGVRPYNLRHAVGIELGERGIDFRDIADMLGHTDDATTRAFYVPVLNSRLRVASEKMAGRLGWLEASAGSVKINPKNRGRTRERKVS